VKLKLHVGLSRSHWDSSGSLVHILPVCSHPVHIVTNRAGTALAPLCRKD